MRVARSVAAASGALLLAGMAAAATLPGRDASATARQASPAVLISPGIVHMHGALAGPPTTAYCQRHFKIGCYTASQIQRAFNLGPLYRKGITGTGETIVIVDSYGSPTVAHDLAVFDKGSGLPAPPRLTIIQPAGQVAPYRATGNREGWAGETDLDVEYAHAIAPGASILLVETPTSENEGSTGFPAIVTAETYVLDHHLGGVISQSFSATEQSFARPERLLRLRGAYQLAARKGVTVLAASGDSGAADAQYNGYDYFLFPVTSWPGSDPLVTGVGGAQLHLNSAGQDTAVPTVWNDSDNKPTLGYITGSAEDSPLATGGGLSVIFARPWYQDGVSSVVGSQRGVPDISMSGACNGGADMYQSFPGQLAGWYPTCGTSEATPQFAGIVALTEQAAGRSLGLINPYLYSMSKFHAPGLVDIVSGNNTVSFRQGGKWHTIAGFDAGPGYDLASGVGTVNASLFVPELACMASRWNAADPQAQPQVQGRAPGAGPAAARPGAVVQLLAGPQPLAPTSEQGAATLQAGVTGPAAVTGPGTAAAQAAAEAHAARYCLSRS
jgi:subtilase family serine protease